jgi:hypothetical protein
MEKYYVCLETNIGTQINNKQFPTIKDTGRFTTA